MAASSSAPPDHRESSRLSIGQWLTDLLFPPTCVGCGELLPPFDAARPIFCPACLAQCRDSRLPCEADVHIGAQGRSVHISLFVYRAGVTDGIPEKLVYHIKHKGERRVFDHVAHALGARVAAVWQNTAPAVDLETVVWVYPPRRPASRRKDGFDQAERLAKSLANVCGGECLPLIDRTNRRAKEQKRLNADDRRANTAHAYEIPPEAVPHIKGRTIMLVDDVCTTGATLGACTELLMNAGAALVMWVTVARTDGKNMT